MIWFEDCSLLLDCPSQAVGIAACVDFSDYIECLQIDDGDESVSGKGYVCALSIWLHEDAPSAATADANALDSLLGGDVENNKLCAGGDECFGSSGVNLRRLAPRAFAWRVAVTFFAAISMTETVPSHAFATQACLPSDETSNPSAPRPTGITVSFQSPPGGPGGGPPGPRIPGGGTPAPCQSGAPAP